jgi:hypothetical protein
VEVARSLGIQVKARNLNSPSFIEHEGKFRQDAWNWMEDALEPEEGDWIFSFDADEFLINWDRESPKSVLQRLASDSEKIGVRSRRMKVDEVFSVDENGDPWIRTDGYWDNIVQNRFYEYISDPWANKFKEIPLACGSLPKGGETSIPTGRVGILHYGYARASDRLEKYRRYRGLHGHSSEHIDSIIQPPTLSKWQGPVPNIQVRSNL